LIWARWNEMRSRTTSLSAMNFLAKSASLPSLSPRAFSNSAAASLTALSASRQSWAASPFV